MSKVEFLSDAAADNVLAPLLSVLIVVCPLSQQSILVTYTKKCLPIERLERPSTPPSASVDDEPESSLFRFIACLIRY